IFLLFVGRVRRRRSDASLPTHYLNDDGTWFDAPPVYVPVHFVTVAPLAVGVSRNVTCVDAPMFCVVPVITPDATETPPLTYCVDNVEQPAFDVVPGSDPCVDRYSETDVLHAAIAASSSDTFARIT